MPIDYQYLTAEQAADEFYDVDEDCFHKQLAAIGATDPRLARAFARTRQNYQNQKFGEQRSNT